MTTLTRRDLMIGGLGLLGAAALTACTPRTPPAVPVPSSTSTAAADASGFLSRHDLTGMDAVDIVDHLDQMPVAERPTDLLASVRADHLLLADAEQELAIPLPQDRFYLSLAPYLDQTHECFHHSLTTCQGELADEQIAVRILDEVTGEALADGQRTTFDNGFVGFWLPPGISGTMDITYDRFSSQGAFSTHDEAATCLTTIQLTDGRSAGDSLT